jgi:light-regulated signal transduction histidine kinase (bacteriophytochrome)
VRDLEAARADLIRRGEELARSNADLEQFAYVASHDLQEPLRKVSNFCQLLERQYSDGLDERGHQYIGYAVDGARRMQILINDLLDFSRVGRTTEQFAMVDMNSVLADAVSEVEHSFDDPVRAEPLPTVWGDYQLLVTLFGNLIGNALKYRSELEPRITVTADDEDGLASFAVADNGIGIDPQYADRIFVIFQRLHLRDQYGGTGIGLAMCKKIVEFHGGRIWLDTTYQPGARFRFTLPRGEAGAR